jgi:hypothetical protein
VLALTALGGCAAGVDTSVTADPEAAAKVDSLADRTPVRLPVRLRFSDEMVESGDSAVVEAQARAWNEELGFDAVLVGDMPGTGCPVDVIFDDDFLDPKGWMASEKALGACAARIRIKYDLDPERLPSVSSHELCHLLKATGQHSQDTSSVCADGWNAGRDIKPEDVAQVLARVPESQGGTKPDGESR